MKHPTIALVQSCCSTLREIKQIHAQLLVNGVLQHPFFLAQFVAVVSLNHPDTLDYSNRVLHQCHSPTIFAFNSMIRAYSRSTTPQTSFQFYNRILQISNLSPDNYTFTFLVRACAATQLMAARQAGPAVHGSVVRRGFHMDPHVQSGLVFMYSELGELGSARQVFVEIPDPDLVCQTAMVCACARSGDLSNARSLFDEMPYRDNVAWSGMVAGYVQCGSPREALELFHSMQLEGVKVNDVSMVSVVSACAHLGALDQGRWAHVYIEKNNIRMTVTLGTALIDMYSKCGDIDKAMDVFWQMKEKNVHTWSSAIGGLAMNGAGRKCLQIFNLMKLQGILPNQVTFLALLQGCINSGLVKEGKEVFNSMSKAYGIEPLPEHYNCMVDLYGRSGRFEEAMGVIKSMPMNPQAGAWGALLNACRIYGNKELGELASRKLAEMETENHGAYVQLSNIYADCRNWVGVDDTRRAMKDGDVKKVPGCSVMEVDAT
ncbi:hypothetical protein V2J09_013027 [Rumex salicifolius]